MARITVEDCLSKETNRFALVLLAAKRTKQLLHGAPHLLNEKCDNKSVVTSLREIADGSVRFMTAEEMELAERKAEEERYQNKAPAARPEPASIADAGDSGSNSSGSDSDDSSEEEVVAKEIETPELGVAAGHSSNGESSS